MRQVFLDHQSSTPALPQVVDVMRPFFTEAFGNPSSLHQHGLRVRDALDKAREQVARMINAESPEEIIFTSGGTEAANLAVKGVAYASRRKGNHIILSEIEHPAVINSANFLEKEGFNTSRIKVDAVGAVDPDEVSSAITDQTILVCVHHVNHDIGTIERIREISRFTSQRAIPLFVDAAASAGWLPIDVRAMGVNLLSFSAHRFYGPKGVGVLYRNRRTRIASQIHGGDQEGGRRAGTENVPAIIGAGVAAEIATLEMPARIAHTAKLQRYLWEKLRAGIPYIQLNGPSPGAERITTNLSINTEFIEGESQMLLCDVHGIAVASGTSCVSKSLKISHVLSAIGLDESLAQGNIILSIGQENTVDEMDYFVETFEKIVNKLRAMSPAWDQFQKGLSDSLIWPNGRVNASQAAHPLHRSLK
jgi:cysteine desulfurase